MSESRSGPAWMKSQLNDDVGKSSKNFDQVDSSVVAGKFDLPVEVAKQVDIVDYKILKSRKQHTVYNLEITVNDKQYVIRHRYNDFVHLRDQLKEEFPEIDFNLPSKKWFFNFEDEHLKSRKQALEAFIRVILEIPRIKISKPVQQFLQPRKKQSDDEQVKKDQNCSTNTETVISESSVPVSPICKYNFEHQRRGRCIIINNRSFSRYKRCTTREGTQCDAARAEKVFRNLGFEVKVHNDLTTHDMETVLREESERDHSDADCFACVMLSHGEEDSIYGTDEELVEIDYLISLFKGNMCYSLVGKPKLFFIQACRGLELDRGISVDETDAARDESNSNFERNRKIPIEADILVAYAVRSGYAAFRNVKSGSWFIQVLCQVLEEHGSTVELSNIMTMVNYLVATDETHTPDESTCGLKQVPEIRSTLRKLAYFKPKPTNVF